MTKNKNKIYKIIKNNDYVRIPKLVRELGVSRQTVHKHLSSLLKDGLVSKNGKPPTVFYKISNKPDYTDIEEIAEEVQSFINDNFITITETGKKYTGIEGFSHWCNKRNLSVKKTANEYITTLNKYKKYHTKYGISGLKKITDTFENVYLDELFYGDFYSIERFGKTKLGQYLLYAKQSQNRELMKQISKLIQPKIREIINHYKILNVIFVPPTVKRQVQLMNEIEYYLDLKITKINVTKIRTEFIIPQKTLSKLTDRVSNAQNTFVVSENVVPGNNILIIDDAVGSGATMNEIAKKIRKQRHTGKIIGFSITGSFKGFDVISEV